ncbi:MAG: XRE family transcriptional regulator [Dysgonomonas sp.]
MDGLKNLSNYLKAERTKHNIKMDELASLIGKSPAAIFYLERTANTNVVFNYLSELRKKGVDLNTLFDEAEQ